MVWNNHIKLIGKPSEEYIHGKGKIDELPTPFKIRVAEPNIIEEDAQAVYNAVKEECLSGSGPYNKQFEKKLINNQDFFNSFKNLSQKLNLLTDEVRFGQGFKILSLPPDINYYDLQFYFWIIVNLLGEPLVQNKEGDRLVYVYDRDRYKKISDGARYHQTHEGGSPHTDNVNIPEKWNYLLVCCFEPAIAGGESIIVNGIKNLKFWSKVNDIEIQYRLLAK